MFAKRKEKNVSTSTWAAKAQFAQIVRRLSATSSPDVRVPDVGVIFLLYRSSLINQSPPPLATSCRSTCVSAGNITPADEQSESDRAVVGDKKLDRKRYRFGFKSAAAAVGYMY